MIIYTKEHGCYFENETNKKHYHLYEAMTYKGNTTSDAIVIWDHDNDRIVNHVYGANTIDVDELDKMVSNYVAEYEAKQKATQKQEIAVEYRFTRAGLKAFEDQASSDFFAEMDKEWDEQELNKFDIVVSCGEHQIRVPLGAEEWDIVNAMLRECLEVNE